MTHQPDFFGLSIDEIMHLADNTAFIQPREVRKPKLRDVLAEASRFDVGHEIKLPERARSDHR